jgi:hypothetical protein
MHRASQFGHTQVQATHDLRRAPTDDRGIGMASFRHDQTINLQLSEPRRVHCDLFWLRRPVTRQNFGVWGRRGTLPGSTILIAIKNQSSASRRK